MADNTVKNALDFADSVPTGDDQATTWAERQLEAQLHIIRLLAKLVENTTPRKEIRYAEDLPVNLPESGIHVPFDLHMRNCNNAQHPGRCRYGEVDYCPACQ